MTNERHFKIGELVYFPTTNEQGVFRLMQTRVVAVEQERMSIYSYAYFIYVGDRLYRVHFDDLFSTPKEFCEEVKYRVVVNL